MRDQLVTIEDGKMMTTSRQVAKVFGRNHKDILKAINNLDVPEEFTMKEYAPRNFITEKGNTYQEIVMTRDGFTLLVMGFMGKEAMKWKLKYLAAFNAMEEELLKRDNKLEWKQARLQSTTARKSFTEIVKQFVDYATSQGSQSAGRYYANLTKMEYAALGLIDYSSKVPDGFRNTLDAMELSYLTAAEYIARQAFEAGMEKKMHYKDIYQYAKLAVTNYATSLILPKLENTQQINLS